MRRAAAVGSLLLMGMLTMSATTKYEPNWSSLDQRPLPRWYDEAKVGIFVHWGVYSVPSFGSEWFWTNWQNLKYETYVKFMEKNYKPGFTYQEFAHEFTAELFNATQWAHLFEQSGAKYVVLTSKHHDGYTLWPSKQSFGWNSVDIGPKRDIINELATAIRSQTSMKFGLYYSLFEWFNRLYIDDKLQLFSTQNFVNQKVRPEQMELVEKYLPEVLWSDGDWEAADSYWKAQEFLAWLYNDSPVHETIVTNDRWGFATACTHGDFYNCQDRFNPGTLQPHKWENAFTLDKTSWGQRFDTNIADFMTSKELINEIVTTVSCNGNVLVNVGPTRYGTIQPIFQERLRDMGEWLKTNAEAIYASRPWIFQNDSVTAGVWYTSKVNDSRDVVNVYAMVLNYPYDTNEIQLYPMGKHDEARVQNFFKGHVLLTGLEVVYLQMSLEDKVAAVVLLGMEDENIEWSIAANNSLHIKFPPKHRIDKRGLQHAWTFRITIDK